MRQLLTVIRNNRVGGMFVNMATHNTPYIYKQSYKRNFIYNIFRIHYTFPTDFTS